MILAQTERIRVFQDVGNLPLRPPAVFAKAAATLDLLSGGRFEAGLGGGGFFDAAHAMGAPALTPGESLEALEEAVAILRASWNDNRALRFEAAITTRRRAARAQAGTPDRDLARRGEAARPRAHGAGRRRLGRPADELHASGCHRRGAGGHRPGRARGRPRPARDPAHLQRTRRVHRHSPASARDTDQTIVGPPDHWAEVLSHLALDLGFGTFALIAPPDPDPLRTFIEEVAPQVRERVVAARAQAKPAAPGTQMTSFEESPRRTEAERCSRSSSGSIR